MPIFWVRTGRPPVQWLPEQEGRGDLGRRLSPLTTFKRTAANLTVQGENDHTGLRTGVRRRAQAGRRRREMMTVAGAAWVLKGQWPAVHARIFDFLRRRALLPPRAP